MSNPFRRTLLQSAATATLLAAGAGFASAQVVPANGGGSYLATPYYETQITNMQVAAFSNDSYNYCSSSSGAAQAAFLGNAIGRFGCPPKPAFDSNTSPNEPTGYPATGNVDFAASDVPVPPNQISAFASAFGQQLIQVPSFGTPVTLPFHLANLPQANGGLKLTTDQVCGIFSGQITDWSSIPAASTSGAITVVYESEGSGTSFLLTQHLGAACTSTNSAFFSPGFLNAGLTSFAGTADFAGLFPNGMPPANFVEVTGSPAVAATVLADANAVGYLSPDLTREAPANASNPNLPFVAFVDGVEPSSANTATALGAAALPANPADQTEWIPKVVNPTTGYSIVGYTTLDFATCYQSATVAGELADFLNVLYNNQPAAGSTGRTMFTQITDNGFTPLLGERLVGDGTVAAGSFAADVVANFVTNSSGNNLQIRACIPRR